MLTAVACGDLLVALQKLATARGRLARVNAIEKDALECDMVLPGSPGVGAERVYMPMPKGLAQQSLINQIRRLEATIRSYGVEPPAT